MECMCFKGDYTYKILDDYQARLSELVTLQHCRLAKAMPVSRCDATKTARANQCKSGIPNPFVSLAKTTNWMEDRSASAPGQVHLLCVSQRCQRSETNCSPKQKGDTYTSAVTTHS